MKSFEEHYSAEKIEHHAEILANRVKKNYRHFSRRYRKQNIDCFRLYDWDIPEVRAVVDWYAGYIVMAEYVRRQTGPEWLPRMAQAVRDALDIPEEKMYIKHRRTKTESGPRYQRLDQQNRRFEVNERDLKFWVNPSDFLDTGLYSDHRDTRVMIRDLAQGKDFLNLFAYTGAFTCAAAKGEAKTTTTVDRSATYVEWAQDNLTLNGLNSEHHTFIQSDVNAFLKQARQQEKKYDLVFVDPPSFFQDERKDVSFDINRDHPQLLCDVIELMTPESTLFFSTNHQRFEPMLDDLPVKHLREITSKTVPEDYHNREVHRCWRMTVL